VKILFLCVANSARSQMAEGLARKLFDKRVTVLSAGSEPATVNPYAINAMKNINIDISNHYSKPISDVLINDVDVAITLCADEVCPILPNTTTKEHWPFEDPAGASGSQEEIEKSFEVVRDQIRLRLKEFGQRKGILAQDD